MMMLARGEAVGVWTSDCVNITLDMARLVVAIESIELLLLKMGLEPKTEVKLGSFSVAFAVVEVEVALAVVEVEVALAVVEVEAGLCGGNEIEGTVGEEVSLMPLPIVIVN